MSLPLHRAEGFVLAGGNSNRMGHEKALIQLAGRPLVQHAVEIMRRAGLAVRIAGARANLSPFAETVLDEPAQSGLGPLAGICSALSVANCRFAVFLPVDLPLIPSGLIEFLVHRAQITESAVAVASLAAFVQTFPVVLDRATLVDLQRRLLSSNRNCLKAFRSAADTLGRPFTELPIERFVDQSYFRDLRRMAPSQWFLNLNSPPDLALAEALFSQSDPVE